MPPHFFPMTVLTEAARDFLTELHRRFEPRRAEILRLRRESHQSLEQILDRAESEDRAWRDPAWKVAPIPSALQKRHVEITGPAEPKMVINALNSGADIFMADFEDSLSPTWDNILEGHAALQKALRRTLTYTNEAGKTYRLNDSKLATLIVRPRGWHLPEPRFAIDGAPMSASLFDFGLYLFHGGRFGFETGRGPYFYLPKLESPLEAKLWSDVFDWSERELNLCSNVTGETVIRATVLIETLPAALQMEEIMFELRRYINGLNAGRWDYLFSMIKSTAESKYEVTFPDRGQLTMNVPFMRRYAEKIVAVCRRRNAQPIGGMSALIPSRSDQEKNERALKNVRADKDREVRQGFVGTWVAHPDLVTIARAAFEEGKAEEPSRPEATAHELLPKSSDEPFSTFAPTVDGAKLNIDVALRYIANWVTGLGAVAIHGLMEDAATAEISRAQLWQWRKNQTVLDDKVLLSRDWLLATTHACAERIKTEIKNDSLSIAESDLKVATELLLELVLSDAKSFQPFLTLPAMDRLNHEQQGDSDVHTRI